MYGGSAGSANWLTIVSCSTWPPLCGVVTFHDGWVSVRNSTAVWLHGGFTPMHAVATCSVLKAKLLTLVRDHVGIDADASAVQHQYCFDSYASQNIRSMTASLKVDVCHLCACHTAANPFF